MGENSELEEGEMNCSTNEGIVDLDVDLSHIDKKVQNVLGHLQKDYGVGALCLSGPKIYDYGSFLPGHKYSLSVPSCQKSSIGNNAVQRFSSNLPGKNVAQKLQSLPTTSCKLVVSNQDPQNYQTSGFLLAQDPGKVPIKKGHARIPGNGLSDHKPIRVRIKMGSEILSQKFTMVCNDVGLVNNRNSTPRNSHDDSSRMLPHTSLEKTSDSPYHILQEMTAIPFQGNLLMSPLPEYLLLVKDKEKRYTLLDNEPVLKEEMKSSIPTQNKFSEGLRCGETPRVRRRKAADCFDATTWNETSSIGEMKKPKVISTGQLARENSACGLGGASSTNDGLATKSRLQKGIKKDGKSDIIFAKSNKMMVVGKQTEKEKKTYPTKLKQNSRKNGFGDKFLSEMTFKDVAYIGQNSMDIGLDFAVVPSSTLDLDNWAQCDGCETWRLLPFGLKPEQLPDKWLCSMQSWLPGMNHCGISEEETTNVIKYFHGTVTHGPETGAKIFSDPSNADKIYQPVTCGSVPNPIKKNTTVKDLLHGVSTRTAEPMRSNSHVYKIKNMKLPLETPNATQISTDLDVSHNSVLDKIDQKAKRRSAGTSSQIKIKKKNEGDKQESESSKQFKTGDGNKLSGDIKAEEVLRKQDLEWTPAEIKTKRHDNEFCTSDIERDTKKRLLASKKKPDNKSQLSTDSGSLCTKAHGRINSPVRKIKLIGYKHGNNENNSKLLTDGEEKELSFEKMITTKIPVQEIKAHQRKELFQADGSREQRNADDSGRYFSGGNGQISAIETSSASKAYGSHKSGRRYVGEVKASPVESVSSSPGRSSCPKNLASAGENISQKNQNLKCGDAGTRIFDNRKSSHQEAHCEVLSTTQPSNRKQPKPEPCKQNSKFGDFPCTSMKSVFENRAGVKNFSALTHETMDRSCQAANDILQEAEKLRKLADCFKSSGFDYEHKEANFKAALKFLLGASLLEICSTENVEGRKMSYVEAYHIAAKISESCAHQYETSQEMAAAALAYKCMEVACMRVVYGKSPGLSGELNELQKMVQMTPQGESPSSSASDVDSFCHQGVIDKSAKTKKGLPHVTENHLPAARNHQSFVPLLDFTENMNMAMEASAKSQNAFRAVIFTSEETQHGDCVSAIKKVVNFSFHDVEALIQMIELAMDVLSSSRFCGPKR